MPKQSITETAKELAGHITAIIENDDTPGDIKEGLVEGLIHASNAYSATVYDPKILPVFLEVAIEAEQAANKRKLLRK
jgi:hypothetical protein